MTEDEQLRSALPTPGLSVLRQNDQYGRARTVTNDFPSKSVCHNWQTGKEDDMNRLLAITVTALAMGLTPAMATEDSLPPTKPPTANTVPPEAVSHHSTVGQRRYFGWCH